MEYDVSVKHTPGPWKVEPGHPITIHSKTTMWPVLEDGIPVSRIGAFIADAGDNEANARLIAAAPELLNALVEAENALSDYIPTIECNGKANLNYGHAVLRQCRVAIAKAIA